MGVTTEFHLAVERAVDPADFRVEGAEGGFDVVVLRPRSVRRGRGGERRGRLAHRVRVDPARRTFTIVDTTSASAGRRGGLGFGALYSAGRAVAAPGHEPIRAAAAACGLTERRPGVVTASHVMAVVGGLVALVALALVVSLLVR